MMAAPTRGFTLIELMIALAIAAMLVVLALPNYAAWVADNQIQSAAESIAGGLRYAQSQAINQNSQVEFVLNPAAGTGGWAVNLVSDGSNLRVGKFAEGSALATFATYDVANAPGATKITFTGLGYRSTDAFGNPQNWDATPVLAQVCIRHPMASGAVCTADAGGRVRPLNVLVFGGPSGVAGQASRTGIKICDPKWPATDPKGCPA